jgi:polyisoprenoid-binding protein YceI
METVLLIENDPANLVALAMVLRSLGYTVLTNQIQLKGTKVTEMSAANAIAAPTTTWNIDPVHSTAEFKVKHMMISNCQRTVLRHQRGDFAGRLRCD